MYLALLLFTTFLAGEFGSRITLCFFVGRLALFKGELFSGRWAFLGLLVLQWFLGTFSWHGG